MISHNNDEGTDFKKLLVSSYANLAIMEMRLYNDSTETDRPSFKEILFMYVISDTPNCTATDLVKLFNSTKAMISQTLINMESRGLIKRTKSDGDSRKLIITVCEDKIKEIMGGVNIYEEALMKIEERYSKKQLIDSAQVICDFTRAFRDASIERLPKRN